MKRFILQDDYEANDPMLLKSTEYVKALEEALAQLGKYITARDEEEVKSIFICNEPHLQTTWQN